MCIPDEKLPLRDPLLQHARVVDPAKQLTATQEDLQYFLERFPSLLPAGTSVERSSFPHTR